MFFYVIRCDPTTFHATVKFRALRSADANIKIVRIEYKFLRFRFEHISPIIFQNGVRFIIGNTQCPRQPHESTVGIIIPVGTLSTTPPGDPALLCGVSCTQQYQLLCRGRKENILAFSGCQRILLSCIDGTGEYCVLCQKFEQGNGVLW